MQEKAQPCASLWRKTLRPKRVRFLAIDAPIVDYVCLPLYHLTFLGSYQPLCEFSWRKKKEKARKKGSGFIDKFLTWVSGLPRSITTPIHHFVQYAKVTLLEIHHFVQYAKVTLLEISPCQGPIVKRSGVAYSCSYALLVRLILGKCKALWGKPRTSWRLSELSCTRFDEERSKKSKAIDEQRCATFFFFFAWTHISPRTSSTVVRVQVGGVCELRTLAGVPGLVIVLDPACACQWERRRTLKKG